MISVLGEALEEKKLDLCEAVLTWATDSFPRYPWRRPGVNAYHVLMGELWLERTTPPVAIWVYHLLIQRFSGLQDLAHVQVDELSDMLSSFGLEQYAGEMIALAKSLLREGRGEFPRDFYSLGVIASLESHSLQAVMCFGYCLPVMVIDSNVARMLRRMFGKTLYTDFSEGLLGALGESLLPAKKTQLFCRGFLELAEMICRVESPLCSVCPVAGACDEGKYLLKGSAHNQGQRDDMTDEEAAYSDHALKLRFAHFTG